jgi:predicted TPR repeat methyltransferase
MSSSPSPLDAALTAHQRGDFAAAEAAYRAILQSNSAEATAAKRLLGTLLLQSGRNDEAVIALQAAVTADPDNEEARVNLAIALRLGGDGAASETHAAAVVRSNPARASAWNAWGLALMEQDRQADAADVFRQAQLQHPTLPQFPLHRGQCLQQTGQWRDAEAAFRQALQLAPDLGEAWRSLGRLQASLGQHQAAIASFQRAAQSLGPEPQLAVELAASLSAIGQHDPAENLLRGAVQADPQHAEAWYGLGRSLLARGRSAEATDALEQAQRLQPDDPVIAHLLAAARGEVPATVEADYVQRLFDDFAPRFEQTLVEKLHYGVPDALAQLIQQHAAEPPRRVLDLGCGTGLMAEALARAFPAQALHIDGVDLSPRMLDLARAKGRYASLHAAEITAFLQQASEAWDLIIAADVFVYLGDLRPVFQAVAQRLAPGGLFAFSVETTEAAAVELDRRSARYRHSLSDIHPALTRAGLDRMHETPNLPRTEAGRALPGALLLAMRR